MSNWLLGFMIGLLLFLAWLSGYHFGKADGIREVRHLMDEQWRDYETFRELVCRELRIEEE